MARKKPTVPRATVNPTTKHEAMGHPTPETPLLTEQADATWPRLLSVCCHPDTAESLMWGEARQKELCEAAVDVIHACLCDDKQRHNRVSGRVVLQLCGSPTAQKIHLHYNIFALLEASPLMWLQGTESVRQFSAVRVGAIEV